jgi:hypothetical protein
MDEKWMTRHDTMGHRVILLWQILMMMMMSASKMLVKTLANFESMIVNKQGFLRH